VWGLLLKWTYIIYKYITFEFYICFKCCSKQSYLQILWTLIETISRSNARILIHMYIWSLTLMLPRQFYINSPFKYVDKKLRVMDIYIYINIYDEPLLGSEWSMTKVNIYICIYIYIYSKHLSILNVSVKRSMNLNDPSRGSPTDALLRLLFPLANVDR